VLTILSCKGDNESSISNVLHPIQENYLSNVFERLAKYMYISIIDNLNKTNNE